MAADLQFILIAIFGAMCQELLHWYELRNKLDAQQRKLFRSKFYWCITISMIIASGIATWILYNDAIPAKPKLPFILGATFPLIFKKLEALTQTRHLGGVPKDAPATFKDASLIYFS